MPQSLIYGVNAVTVALDQGYLRALFVEGSSTNPRINHLHAMAQQAGIPVEPLGRQGWAKNLPADQHQGAAGMLKPLPTAYLEDVVAEAGPDSCVLVLDQIQDPQNLGAILRTAAATGVDAVILPKKGGCPVTPAVHRASAGMSLLVKIVEDENIARAISELKDHGYWVVGCDVDDADDATTFAFPHKRAIVMGNEAEGMRRLVRESCDYLVKVPMAGGVESLNVSVATAVVLYLAMADLARAADEGAPVADGQPAPSDS